MVRTLLPALAVAASAIVVATSVVPAGRALEPTTTAVGMSDTAVGAQPPATPRTNRLAGPPALSGATGAVRGAEAPPVRAAGVRWRWPVQPRPPVVRPFRAPRSDYGAGHRGLDLAVSDGTPVIAVEGGVVTHAGLVAGRGTVTVRHVGGLGSTYEPVQPMVAVGAVVDTGQVLGVLSVRGAPGHCGARACLHLGARRAASYVDPYPLLAGGRLALLPLGR